MGSRVPATLSSPLTAVRERGIKRAPSNPFRWVSLAFSGGLIASFLWVFYSLIDIVGGIVRLYSVVAVTLIAATLAAHILTIRRGLLAGGALLVLGMFAYLVTFPGFQRVVFTPSFAYGLSTHLTGITVLRFPKIDLWVLAMAPGPVFLSWYLALRRRYDASALIGGAILGFFTLTGDAGTSTVLVGMASLLGVLGAGSLERSGTTLAQVEQLGFVLAIAVLVSRIVRIVPDWGSSVSPPASGGSGGGVAGRLVAPEEQLSVFGHITLSPEVLFRVSADEAAYWHVAAYDRYTGSGWVRTGESTSRDGGLSPPPGDSTRLRQSYQALSAVRTMPAAWKPVRVSTGGTDARVTAAGSLQPTQWLTPGDTYTVVSRIPEWTPETLRTAGSDYPAWVEDRYLQLPSSTPSRIAAFTAQLTANAENAYETATVIERWLTRNRGYSLDVTRPRGDLAAAFLFDMDDGYCTYFATTMVVMLRTQDIPARLALGYTSGEQTDRNEWVVRGLDSHAWVEVYFPGVGWVSFDPTPAGPRREVERTRFEPGQATAGSFETGGDAAETPTPSPADPGGANGGTTGPPTPTDSGDPGTEPQSPGGSNATGVDIGDEFTSPDGPGGWPADLTRDRLALLSAAAALLIGTHRMRLVNRGYHALRIRRQTPTESPALDIEQAFDRLEYLLARRHRARAADETPRQYLSAVPGSTDPRARRVVDIYEQSRYAGTVSRAMADEAIELVDELVAESGWP